MKILQTLTFKKQFKKLHDKERKIVVEAIAQISAKPNIGILKKSELSNVRVYKFNVVNQQVLIAYEVLKKDELILLTLDSHENFYRDLKKHIN